MGIRFFYTNGYVVIGLVYALDILDIFLFSLILVFTKISKRNTISNTETKAQTNGSVDEFVRRWSNSKRKSRINMKLSDMKWLYSTRKVRNMP